MRHHHHHIIRIREYDRTKETHIRPKPKPCYDIRGRVALLDRLFDGSRRRACVGHGSARRQENNETTATGALGLGIGIFIRHDCSLCKTRAHIRRRVSKELLEGSGGNPHMRRRERPSAVNTRSSSQVGMWEGLLSAAAAIRRSLINSSVVLTQAESLAGLRRLNLRD
jgi:hypothetical protein